jgi:hypothetical protein
MANVHFTQQATFGYGASVPAGFVYPNGVVRTGDPIFTSLVRRIHVDIAYRAKADAPLKLAGSWRPLLVLSGPSGWHRTVPLGPRERLRSAAADTSITLDLSYLQSMLARVAGLTHLPAALYTIGVGGNVHVVGAIAGRPVDTVFQPSLNLQFMPQQLQVVGTSGGTGTKSQLSATSTGSVIAPVDAPNAVHVFGLGVDVSTLRLIAVFGFLIAAASALVLLTLSRLAKPREELARIRAKYGHMIVPVLATDEALNWVSFDVPTIEALARIAEAGGRVILHHQDDFSDTLLVQDDSAVYRYQVQRPIKWHEWAKPGQVLPGPGAVAGTNGPAADDAGAAAA